MKVIRKSLAALFVLFIFTGMAEKPAKPEITAPAATIGVLNKVIEAAPEGAVVKIAPGRYEIADLKITRNLSLIGIESVVFYSRKPVQKGLLNPLPGISLTVENITFLGARSPDKNGAGIRHDGENLSVINCVFKGNENGILATGDASGELFVENSVFKDSGHGDGYSHGIYAVRGKSLEITSSRFTGTKIGHHVKSLTDNTAVTNSVLDDADGRTSYAIDASKGGSVLISGNTIIQAVDSDNPAIINYDQTRGGQAEALRIINNQIINRHRRGKLLRNATSLEPEIYGNQITNEGRGVLDES